MIKSIPKLARSTELSTQLIFLRFVYPIGVGFGGCVGQSFRGDKTRAYIFYHEKLSRPFMRRVREQTFCES